MNVFMTLIKNIKNLFMCKFICQYEKNPISDTTQLIPPPYLLKDITSYSKPLWLTILENDLSDTEKKYRDETTAFFNTFKIDASDNAGYKITNVLSKSNEFIIYEIIKSTGDYSIRIYIRSLIERDDLLTKRWNEIQREFYKTKKVLFKVNDSSVRERMANIISRALSTGYTSDANDDFKDIRKEIDTTYKERVSNSLSYLFTIISIVFIINLLSIFSYYNDWFIHKKCLRELLFSSASGCLGGFISISRKLREMTFEREIPKFTYCLYGVERMLISICCSVIIYFAIKSNFVFNSGNNSIFITLLGGVTAGFSDTLIPNLLVKMETEKMKSVAGKK